LCTPSPLPLQSIINSSVIYTCLRLRLLLLLHLLPIPLSLPRNETQLNSKQCGFAFIHTYIHFLITGDERGEREAGRQNRQGHSQHVLSTRTPSAALLFASSASDDHSSCLGWVAVMWGERRWWWWWWWWVLLLLCRACRRFALVGWCFSLSYTPASWNEHPQSLLSRKA